MKRFVIRRAVVLAAAAAIAVAAAPRTEASVGNPPAVLATVAAEHDVVGLGWSFWKAVKCGACVGAALGFRIPIEICGRVCRA